MNVFQSITFNGCFQKHNVRYSFKSSCFLCFMKLTLLCLCRLLMILSLLEKVQMFMLMLILVLHKWELKSYAKFLLSLCPFVVLSIWLGAATFKCTRSTHHENILFLFVQITVSFLICWVIPPWSAWILHSNQSNKYHILVLWIWTQKNSILSINQGLYFCTGNSWW